ncbi:MAG: hypothetical protein V7K38_02960 [Nostoc sp.]|uniref:hypothetical protein n=1 Tax=Nostoc sp. TaxID=1180 RepID=UPI002FF47B2A
MAYLFHLERRSIIGLLFILIGIQDCRKLYCFLTDVLPKLQYDIKTSQAILDFFCPLEAADEP